MRKHDKAFIKLLERAREQNLKLTKKKLKFKLQSVTYMGHFLNNTGLKSKRFEKCHVHRMYKLCNTLLEWSLTLANF